jgi:hypothetical protein
MGAPSELDTVGLDHVPPDPEFEAPLSLIDEESGVTQFPVFEAQVPLDDNLR